MKRNLLLTMAVIFSCFTLLIGCSNDEEDSETVSASSENVNETGMPIVDEEITLEIAGPYDARTGTDYNELETIKEINKDTNINVDWQLSPGSDWATKRNLLMNSGDLPDVLLKVTPADVVTGGTQGMFIPLDDLIEQYAPNFKTFLDENPVVRQAITAPDGHIYSLPLADLSEYKLVSGNSLWINEEWLEQVGMDMPETTDELRAALEAFAAEDLNGNGDPNDEIPLTGIWGAGTAGFSYLFGSFDTEDQTFLVRDGDVEFAPSTPQFKEAIKYIGSLYQDGLIDQEIFTMESEDLISKISSGENANVGAYFEWSLDRITNEKYKNDYGSPILALKGPEGHQARGLQNPQLDQGVFVITNENEHPEATMRWVDQAFEPQMSFFLRQGPNRVQEKDDGTYEITTPEDGMTAGEWRVKETPYNNFPYGHTKDMRAMLDLSNLKPGILDPDKDEWFEISKPHLEDWIFPRILFSAEQYDQISQYETDIGAYTDETVARWITGSSDIEEEWEGYLETLQTMGVEEYTQIYQDAYDLSISNTQ